MAMSRTVSWIRLCPESVSAKIDEALAATFYIVHQTGPTGFVLKEEGVPKKIKVCLGNPHMCSCDNFKKNRELCTHILWVLLKKFRLPRVNPLIWQLAFVEREIDEVLHGCLHRQQPDQSDSCTKSPDRLETIEQRDVGPDDVCPICQVDLLGSDRPLVYCRFGCGQNIHVKCMKIMARHQKTVPGDRQVRCPLCRVYFGPIRVDATKTQQRLCAEKPSLHLGVACSHCHVSPIAGKCYQCSTCVSYYLCHGCFSGNHVHTLHSFQCRKHIRQPWRPVERPTEQPTTPSVPPTNSPVLPPVLVTSLQSRSLTENDYEVLLQLDGSLPRADSNSPADLIRPPRPGVPESVLNTLHAEPLDGNHPLIVNKSSCQVCGGEYHRGEWIKKLPCKHKFHRDCTNEWFKTHSCCPVDGKPVHTPPSERLINRSSKRLDLTQRGLTPVTKALAAQSLSLRGLQGSTVLEGTNFNILSHIIGRSKAVVPPSRSRKRSQNPTAKSDQAPPPLSNSAQRVRKTAPRPASIVLPDLSNVAITSMTMQKQPREPPKKTRFRLSAIPSSGSSGTVYSSSDTTPTHPESNEKGQKYVDTASSGAVSSPLHLSRYGSVAFQTAKDKSEGELTDYISVSRSPLHSTSGSSVSMSKEGEKQFVSLPSLPLNGQRQVSKLNGSSPGKVIRGSLYHPTHSFPKITTKQLDKSLQVSSFKLCPLSLTHSIMTATSTSIKLD